MTEVFKDVELRYRCGHVRGLDRPDPFFDAHTKRHSRPRLFTPSERAALA
jgi:hypothetical protein